MIPLRLVLDTNILDSAALKPDGLQRIVLLLATYVTEEILVAGPVDNKFVECANAARADYLLTGNQPHFPKFWKKTKVITSREFIGIVAPHLLS